MTLAEYEARTAQSKRWIARWRVVSRFCQFFMTCSIPLFVLEKWAPALWCATLGVGLHGLWEWMDTRISAMHRSLITDLEAMMGRGLERPE